MRDSSFARDSAAVSGELSVGCYCLRALDGGDEPTSYLSGAAERSRYANLGYQRNDRHGAKLWSSGSKLSDILSYVQGHIKDAIALAQRIQLACYATLSQTSTQTVRAKHVHSSMLALVKDIEVTFEALLLLLPPTQAKLLESLSIDPTERPQSNAYIKKHYLSRGGSLQGALSSLEQKGLIYGPQFGYCVSLPLLDFWIKHSQRL